MKKPVLFASACGAVFPLVAAATLAIVMPALGTWVVVMAIAIVAGASVAWIGHEGYLLLASVREQIEAGTRTTLKELGESRKETRAVRSEADERIAERLERFFEESGKRDEEWRRNTLAEWEKTKADVQEVFKGLVENLREHFTSISATEREALSHRLDQLGKATQNVVERHATVIQATKEAIASVGDHLNKQRASEAELRQAALDDYQEVTKELGASFADMLSDLKTHLKTLADEERAEQERAEQSRAEAIDAELAKVRKTFDVAAQGIAVAKERIKESHTKLNAEVGRAIAELESETRRQQAQNRADRDHFQKMLENQRKAHEEADKHSEQLWCRLLDQLEK